jgi:hypothetical protein
MNSFEWLPTECADERYPMQLISGDLHCSDGEVVAVPTGKIVNNGWGEIGSRRIVGEQLKGVPERLEVAWFSYAEDQFFAGSVPLPHAELTQLFVQGFQEPLTRERVTWSKIIVGMGLGGWASVWLAGSGLVQSVADAKLEPAQIDWASVLDNPDITRSDFVRAKLQSRLSSAELKAHVAHGPPVSTWPKYSRRDRWRIRVDGIRVPLNMFLRSFNGERRFYDFARQPPEQLDAVPKHLQITWLSPNGRKLLTDIRLDETEIFDAFDKAGAADLDTSTTMLKVELGTRMRVALVVESKAGRVALTRSSAEVLSVAD